LRIRPDQPLKLALPVVRLRPAFPSLAAALFGKRTAVVEKSLTRGGAAVVTGRGVWCAASAPALVRSGSLLLQPFEHVPELLVELLRLLQHRGVADVRDVAEAKWQAAADEADARRRVMVPAKETVDVVLRYEGQLQLTRTLHE
jgi:hypothetical protein